MLEAGYYQMAIAPVKYVDRLFGISQKVRSPSPILLNLNTCGNTQTISDL
jgi:hypothetical protein